MTRKELKTINYKFLYVLVKYTDTEDDAISSVEVEIADFKKGPSKKPFYILKKIPIQQYRGVKATYQTVPWLCIQKGGNGNKFLTDVKLLVSFYKVFFKLIVC